MTFEELIEIMATAYKNPVKGNEDRNGNTRLSVLQKRYHLSSLKIQKLLVTAGVYEPVKANTPYEMIRRLRHEGKSANEIQKLTGLSNASVNAYLPYEITPHNAELLGVETGYDATRKRKQRNREVMRRENAMSLMQNSISDETFWKVMREHSGEAFITHEGIRYQIDVGDSFTVIKENQSLCFSKSQALTVLHEMINGDECKEEVREYVKPLLVFFGVLDGNPEKVTVRRSFKPNICSCCGRMDLPLHVISSFSDLLTLGEKLEKRRHNAMSEEQREQIGKTRSWMHRNEDAYQKKIEAAKQSRVVRAFNVEGERMLCEVCAESIRMALEDGDIPSVRRISDVSHLSYEEAKYQLDQLLTLSDDTWEDVNGERYVNDYLYAAIDWNAARHTFAFSTHVISDVMIIFEAKEVHRLTKSGKKAKRNTDTDYEVKHLRRINNDNIEQVRVTGLLELMQKIRITLQNPSGEEGGLRSRGTVIPVYMPNKEWSHGEYGLMIDGKMYSGDEFVRMLSVYEGWQVQYQVRDIHDSVLQHHEYLMPISLGEKQLVDETLELLRLFTKNSVFISKHDQDNFEYLFENILEKLKLYHDQNPRGYGKLAAMGMIKALNAYDGTATCIERIRMIIG